LQQSARRQGLDAAGDTGPQTASTPLPQVADLPAPLVTSLPEIPTEAALEAGLATPGARRIWGVARATLPSSGGQPMAAAARGGRRGGANLRAARWRTAIVRAELLAPPLALRNPAAPGAAPGLGQ
jgi:hypothetical protein